MSQRVVQELIVDPLDAVPCDLVAHHHGVVIGSANDFASPDQMPVFIHLTASADLLSMPTSSSLPRISAGLPCPRIAAVSFMPCRSVNRLRGSSPWPP